MYRTVLRRSAEQRRCAAPDSEEGSESGFILITIVLILALLLVLMSITWGAVAVNTNNTADSSGSAQATESADAGLALAGYSIQTAVIASGLPCQLGPTSLPTRTNGVSSSYTVTISYYSSYADPESGSPLTCAQAQGGSLIDAAVISSTGKTHIGAVSSSATITELLSIQDEAAGYVIFSQDPLTLNGSTINAPAGQPTDLGNVYSNGSVSASSSATPCPPNTTMAVAVVAQGSLTSNGTCAITVSGSSWESGSLTWVGGAINGEATVSNGNIALSNDGQIGGDATAGGTASTITLTGAGPPKCPGNQTCIGGNATASGTVTVSNNAGVVGVTTQNSTASVPSPPSITFPSFSAPISAANGGTATQVTAYNNWVAAGYSVLAPTSGSNCSTTALSEISAAMTGRQVVVANCALSISQANTVQFKYNLAIFATGGITVGGTKAQLQAQPGSGAQLFLAVPSDGLTIPPTNPACSSNNITVSTAQALDPATTTFFYTPCTFSTPASANFTAEIVAGAVSLSSSNTITFGSFSVIPGLALPGVGDPGGSYVATVEARYSP